MKEKAKKNRTIKTMLLFVKPKLALKRMTNVKFSNEIKRTLWKTKIKNPNGIKMALINI